MKKTVFPKARNKIASEIATAFVNSGSKDLGVRAQGNDKSNVGAKYSHTFEMLPTIAVQLISYYVPSTVMDNSKCFVATVGDQLQDDCFLKFFHRFLMCDTISCLIK